MIQLVFSRMLQISGAAASLVLVSAVSLSPAATRFVETPRGEGAKRVLLSRASVPDSNQRRRAPILGADETYASEPWPLILGWQDKDKGAAMVAAFKSAGLRSLRLAALLKALIGLVGERAQQREARHLPHPAGCRARKGACRWTTGTGAFEVGPLPDASHSRADQRPKQTFGTKHDRPPLFGFGLAPTREPVRQALT